MANALSPSPARHAGMGLTRRRLCRCRSRTHTSMRGLGPRGLPTLWLVEADAPTTAAIRALIEQAYKAMSTPGDDVARVFEHEDMTVAGSGLGELLYGPEQVISVARMIASHGLTWTPEHVKVWSRGDVAWAQILGYVEVTEDGAVVQVPYWTTGVFGREADGWHWLYW